MNAFSFYTLLWPAILIFVLCLVVTYKVTKWPGMAISLSFLKTVIFLFYFGWLFDGTFTFLDDWHYLQGSEKLLSAGVGVLNLSDSWQLLLNVGGGNHILYYLYNTYAFRLFGIGYYAPVACNILLTVLIAYFGSRLAVKEFGLPYKQGKWCYLFILFQPDILAWSNIMNGKDILVLLLTVLLLQAVALFYRKRIANAVLIAVPVVMLFLFLRYYVPLLFVLALLITSMISSRINLRVRLIYLLTGAVLAVGIYLRLGLSGFQYAIAQVQSDLINPLFGFVRVILTPIPFHTSSAYTFLNIPALFHWLMIPIVILGLNSLRKKPGIFVTFFLVYAFVFISLYAVTGELQGPRHRVQLDYFFAILQFIGLTTVIKSIDFTLRGKLTDKEHRNVISGAIS